MVSFPPEALKAGDSRVLFKVPPPNFIVFAFASAIFSNRVRPSICSYIDKLGINSDFSSSTLMLSSVSFKASVGSPYFCICLLFIGLISSTTRAALGSKSKSSSRGKYSLNLSESAIRESS